MYVALLVATVGVKTSPGAQLSVPMYA
jgi:hypothetical protein